MVADLTQNVMISHGSPRVRINQGGTLVARDSLRVTNVRLMMSYPPSTQYKQTTFPDLYAELAKRHRFESVKLEGERRAQFETDDVRTCELDGSTLTLDEEVQRDFELVKKDFGDILSTIKEHMSLPFFFGPSVTIEARWDVTGEMDVMSIIQQRALKLNDDQLRLLKLDDLESVGFQVHGDVDHAHRVIEIVSSSEDAAQLIITVRCLFHQTVQTVQIAEQRLQEAYDFLTRNVASFVESFTED